MPIPAAIWVTRMLAASTALKNTKVFRKVASKVKIDGHLASSSADTAAAIAIVAALVANPQKYVDLAAAGGGPLIEQLSRLVTGLNIPSGTVAGAVTGVASDESRVALGGIFSRLLDETLQLPTVKEGFLQRAPGLGERTNMERMVGAAFRMQLGDMLAEVAGKKLPFGIGRAFTQIAERIDKAINLDDAIEEIIQVPMQAVITTGMQQFYNRQLKPQDFTESEARNALLQERITPDVYNKVLDNQGVRDDIRETLLDMAAPDLTESDIDQAYQHNLLDRTQVKDHYKGKGFKEPERELKTKLVEGTRRWKLEEKLFELLGNLYRDGVATREECQPHLNHFGYDPDESDMWFQIQELERRQRKFLSSSALWDAINQQKMTFQAAVDYLVLQGMTPEDATIELNTNRKWLTNSELEQMVKAGTANIQWAIEYNVQQGMLPEDATLRWMNYILKQFQKDLPQNCQDELESLFSLPALLSRLLAQIPTLPTGSIFSTSDLQRIIQCLLQSATTP